MQRGQTGKFVCGDPHPADIGQPFEQRAERAPSIKHAALDAQRAAAYSVVHRDDGDSGQWCKTV
jgi:hypothetical protein